MTEHLGHNKCRASTKDDVAMGKVAKTLQLAEAIKPLRDGEDAGEIAGEECVPGTPNCKPEPPDSEMGTDMSRNLSKKREEAAASAAKRRLSDASGKSCDSTRNGIDHEQQKKSYLEAVFAKTTKDGSKEIFFVRSCAPTDDKCQILPEMCQQHAPWSNKVFEKWHPPEVRTSGVDPCLSDLAVMAASTGVPREFRCAESCCEFEGLEGGLQSLVKLVNPQLVVSSPHSSALQTAMVACDSEGCVCPIIVHPDLKHIKKDLTAGGMYPEGKPKFQGVRASELAAALKRGHPYPKVAARVDLSMLSEVWFNPASDFKAQKRCIRSIPTWLAQRPEQRIMVVTHNRVLRHLVGAQVGNGQYAVARLSPTGDLFTTPTITQYTPRFDAHGDDEGSTPSDKVFQVLLIRHCQDEVMAAESDRQICERFEHWHDPSFRAVDDPLEGRRDPCLTEKGILAASDGIEDMLRCSMNQNNGYGGVRGGLRQIVKEFDAELVVSSPLSRAIQTSIVAFDHSPAPVIVHPDLKELKKDYTFNGRYPAGKPGCSGILGSSLRDAVSRHPRASAAPVDTSLLDKGGELWFDPTQSHQSQLDGLEGFVDWLSNRPEKRIAVVSHGGVLRHLLHTELGHGQYIVAELHKKEDKKSKFIVVQFSAGVQPYFE